MWNLDDYDVITRCPFRLWYPDHRVVTAQERINAALKILEDNDRLPSNSLFGIKLVLGGDAVSDIMRKLSAEERRVSTWRFEPLPDVKWCRCCRKSHRMASDLSTTANPPTYDNIFTTEWTSPSTFTNSSSSSFRLVNNTIRSSEISNDLNFWYKPCTPAYTPSGSPSEPTVAEILQERNDESNSNSSRSSLRSSISRSSSLSETEVTRGNDLFDTIMNYSPVSSSDVTMEAEEEVLSDIEMNSDNDREESVNQYEVVEVDNDDMMNNDLPNDLNDVSVEELISMENQEETMIRNELMNDEWNISASDVAVIDEELENLLNFDF